MYLLQRALMIGLFLSGGALIGSQGKQKKAKKQKRFEQLMQRRGATQSNQVQQQEQKLTSETLTIPVPSYLSSDKDTRQSSSQLSTPAQSSLSLSTSKLQKQTNNKQNTLSIVESNVLTMDGTGQRQDEKNEKEESKVDLITFLKKNVATRDRKKGEQLTVQQCKQIQGHFRNHEYLKAIRILYSAPANDQSSTAIYCIWKAKGCWLASLE